MNYYKFKLTISDCVITRKRSTFTREEGAKNWSRVPSEVKDYGIVSLEAYNNFITSIPFFNNFGGKAYCRAKWAYTSVAYVPTEVVTVSPDATTKHVDRFEIISFPRSIAENEAGFRERDCLENAIKCEIQSDGEHRLFTFYHKDGEHAATFDASDRKWTN